MFRCYIMWEVIKAKSNEEDKGAKDALKNDRIKESNYDLEVETVNVDWFFTMSAKTELR